MRLKVDEDIDQFLGDDEDVDEFFDDLDPE